MYAKALLRRLPEYYKTFSGLLMEGYSNIRSEDLAKIMRIRSTSIRRDFSVIGDLGRQGLGYDVATVLKAVGNILNVQTTYKTAVVGFGNLGKAFTYFHIHKAEEYKKKGIKNYPLNIVAAFEKDEQKISETNDIIPVYNVSTLEDYIKREKIEVLVLAMPTEYTRSIVNNVSELGIKGIVNFTSTFIELPKTIALRHLDLFSEVQAVTFDISRIEQSKKKSK